MDEQLIETWKISYRINRYLLSDIDTAALGHSLSPKHRSVFQLFAHMQNVRLMWLKSAAPDLLKGLSKLEGDNGKKEQLDAALEKVAFVGYLISHESHHRGQIGWTLKGTEHALDQKTSYGLWEWGVR
ncbi:MAG: hypothetical protein HY040_03015 [Planctomycetes bacterium]|nr:hypothetical protein [Planctomycetota bacterium]